MTIKADRWIRRMALDHAMIEPFVEEQRGEGMVSYGLSSYGYDIRIADEFKIFTNVHTAVVDPKNFSEKSFVDFKGEVCLIPPNSFALGRTVEYFRIPRNVLTVCLGKCLSANTQVVDASSGRLVYIGDQLGWNGSTASLQGQQVRSVAVTDGMMNGQLPVYRVTTRTGRVIDATPNHPFLTFTGWRQLQGLQPEDRIGVSRRTPIFGNRELPEHEVDLLGLMISDGQCSTPGGSPRYTSGDEVLRSHFSRAVEQFGGVPKDVGVYSVNATNRGRRGGVMERNRMTVWLESLGLAVHSPDKFVPGVVFELRQPLLARFLRALYSGDGGISTSGDGIHLEFCSTSERLARDIQHLLLRFGIVAVVRHRQTASGRGAFILTITSKDHISRFGRHIGFIPGSAKQLRLEEALKQIDAYPQQKSNFDTLPREAWGLLREACAAQGLSLRKAGIPSTQPKQSVSRKLAMDLARRLGNEALADVADSDVLWDRIASIEYLGVQPVYDLTVPETENFIANDVIVHNSTYARCGVLTNVTPFEPGWEGYATLEISNTTPLPAKIYANEGIAQVLFFESDEACEVSYADKKGKYQAQVGITLPRILQKEGRPA